MLEFTDLWTSSNHTRYASNSGLNPSTSADINSPAETFSTFQLFLFTTLAISAASDLTIKEALSIVESTTILASNLARSANSSVPGSFPGSKLDSMKTFFENHKEDFAVVPKDYVAESPRTIEQFRFFVSSKKNLTFISLFRRRSIDK